MTSYSHTQTLPEKLLYGAGAASFLLGFSLPGLIMRMLMWGAAGGVLTMISSLTVEIENQTLKITFGKGIYKKEWNIDEFTDCRKVETKIWQGWGVHFIGNGWLYNIYGRDAIELKMRNGQVTLIGTDEPDKLLDALASIIPVNSTVSS